MRSVFMNLLHSSGQQYLVTTCNVLFLCFFTGISNIYCQSKMPKAELLKQKIDTIFDQCESEGYVTKNKLKYTYRFSDRDRIPILEMGKALEKDSIEVISITQRGKKWEVSAFENKVYTRESMIEKEKEFKWMMYKYKVDDYLGFTISPSDIDISAIPDYDFLSFIKK
ncbi:MAG TPA: hypothetical protein VMZ69_00250, partial [Saprospiraceae bacterium]|nr:hypothetical protein [Saprospiraceae bacterium]